MNTTIIHEIASLPLALDEKQRIQITTRCSDTNSIHKVEGAGWVIESPAGRYQLMHNGIKVLADAYCGRWMTELIRLLKGHHEPQEEKAFNEILKYISGNATMVELGSWWSYYSLWFHQQIPGAKNYMIEPDPNNLEIGKINFDLNGMQGHFLSAAIGETSQVSIPFMCVSDDLVRQVPVISIDDFVLQEQIRNIDLILCDIQGFELEMLRGSINCLKERLIRFIVLSTHHHSISQDPLTHQKCLLFLREQGAHILVEHTIAESFSGDGLIVASFWDEDDKLPEIEISRNSPSNNLFREIEYDLSEAWHNNKQLQMKLEAVQSERDQALQQLSALYQSRAYRITKPLRSAANMIHNLFKRF